LCPETLSRTADGAPEFADGVDHVCVDERAWDDIYVPGDVHGCLRGFDAMLDHLGVTGDDLVVVVGDLVRKGSDGPGVVDRVRAASEFVEPEAEPAPGEGGVREYELAGA